MVIKADLIAAGGQSLSIDLRSAAKPLRWWQDIEVPEMCEYEDKALLHLYSKCVNMIYVPVLHSSIQECANGESTLPENFILKSDFVHLRVATKPVV